MGKNYDNWERLVRAVLRREQFKELSLLSSLSSSSFESSTSEMSMDFFIDKKSGKNCCMLGARQLVFSPYSYVEWIRYHPNSRFTEAAKVNSSYMFVRGSIKAQMLSPETLYAAYLVFRLTKSTITTRQNFRSSAMAATRLVKGAEAGGGRVLLRPKDSKDALAITMQPGESKKGSVVAARKDDGWMELEIRICRGENGDVEARMLKIDRTRGLIVEGIEFRPKIPLDSKKGKTKRKVEGWFSRRKCVFPKELSSGN